MRGPDLDEMAQAGLADELDRERRRVQELRDEVAATQHKVRRRAARLFTHARGHSHATRGAPAPVQVKKLRKKQTTLETNISNLYEVAKRKVDERSRLLTAARLQQSSGARNDVRGGAPPAKRPRGADRPGSGTGYGYG